MIKNHFMSLNIQLFAEESNEVEENIAANTAASDTKESTDSEVKEKSYSRDEVNKMINAEKNKLRDELTKEFEAKKSEADKVSKMNADEKLNYELAEAKKQISSLTAENNAMKVKSEATQYATQKGLPIGYIEDMDFSRESSDSIKSKIDRLVSTRSNDLKGYLNEKLKQPAPQEKGESKEVEDPFIKGYKDYMKKIK